MPSDAPTRERVGFWALLLAALVPLFAGAAFLNPDGPHHVEMARIAAILIRDPGAPEAAFFELNHRLVPNLTLPLMLAPLAGTAPLLAERLAWCLYLLGLPLASAWTVSRAGRPGMPWLVFPLIWSLSLGMGLLNFEQSLVLYALALGYGLTAEVRPGPNVLVYGLGGLVLVFTHPLTFWVTGASLGLIHLWRAGLDRDLRALAARIGWMALGVAPAVAVGAWFTASAPPGANLWEHGTIERLRWLASMDALLTWGPVEVFPALLALATWLVLALWSLRARRGLEVSDALLAVAAFGLVFFLVVPDQSSGGSLVARRSQIFVWLPFVLWVATRRLDSGPRAAALAAIGVGTLIQVGVATQMQRAFDRDRAEILSVTPPIEPGQTLLPVVFAPSGWTETGDEREVRVTPFAAIGADIASRTGAINLSAWQPAHDTFVVRYRPEVHPFRQLGLPYARWEEYPPPFDLPGFESRTGHRIDHILVFGRTQADASDPESEALMGQIEADWELVGVSQPTGIARWYVRADRE